MFLSDPLSTARARPAMASYPTTVPLTARKTRGTLGALAQARFEIWFPSPEEVSVFIEASASGYERELLEIQLFAAFAARQIANLRGEVQRSLCEALASVPRVGTPDAVPLQIGDVRLVAPTPRRGRKGFEGTVVVKEDVPLIHMKPRGFGMMGRGIDYYAPTATYALMFHLLSRLSAAGRDTLVDTANNVGSLGLAGEIRIHTQAGVAGGAVAGALDSLDEDLWQRAEDPEEDYHLLFRLMTRLMEGRSEGSEASKSYMIPTWLAWRLCREMTVAHYDLLTPDLQRRREESKDVEGPTEYDHWLQGLIAGHGLDGVVDRLHSDVFSTAEEVEG